MIRTAAATFLFCSAALPVSAQTLGPEDVPDLLVSLLPSAAIQHGGVGALDDGTSVLRDLSLTFGPVSIQVGDVHFDERGSGFRVNFEERMPATIVERGRLEAHGRLRQRGFGVTVELSRPERPVGQVLMAGSLLEMQMSTHPDSSSRARDHASVSLEGIAGLASLSESHLDASVSLDLLEARTRTSPDVSATSASGRDIMIDVSLPRSALEGGEDATAIADLLERGAGISIDQGRSSSSLVTDEGGFEISNARSRFEALLERGTLSWSQDSRDLTVDIVAPGFAIGGDGFSVPEAVFELHLPFFPGPEGDAARLRLSMPEIRIPEALLREVDPLGQLPAEPFGLSLDLGMGLTHAMTLTDVITELRAGGMPNDIAFGYGRGLTPGVFSIDNVLLSGFGMSISIFGDMVITDFGKMPEGSFDVVIEGLDRFVAALAESDLVDPAELAMGKLMLDMYFSRDEDDYRTARVLIEDGSVTVNGLPLP